MLSTRVDAFRKLDKDGNNLLTFEEWAVDHGQRFAGADADQRRRADAAEFATTAPKRSAKPTACDSLRESCRSQAGHTRSQLRSASLPKSALARSV